jgi:hypothetical protein
MHWHQEHAYKIPPGFSYLQPQDRFLKIGRFPPGIKTPQEKAAAIDGWDLDRICNVLLAEGEEGLYGIIAPEGYDLSKLRLHNKGALTNFTIQESRGLFTVQDFEQLRVVMAMPRGDRFVDIPLFDDLSVHVLPAYLAERMRSYGANVEEHYQAHTRIPLAFAQARK